MSVIGWKLHPSDRAALLDRFPPMWPDVIADHVTLDPRASEAAPLPEVDLAEIVGCSDDGQGLQALVLSIEGTTDRPDGSTYHITWSLDRKRGRKPVESNRVIAERGWKPIDAPIPIRIVPSRFT